MATEAHPPHINGGEHDLGVEEQHLGLDNVAETVVGDSDASVGPDPRTESGKEGEALVDWDRDPNNPYTWTPRRKMLQVLMAAATAFTASIGTSLPSSSRAQIQEEFGVTTTQSILPLSLYVFALGLGPVLGGSLSETIGRFPVYVGSMPVGALFTVGAAVTNNFDVLCFCRFMAGFAFSPSLAIGAGTISDIYKPNESALPSTVFILMPFLGPGFGPVIGAFVSVRKGWRWTQWTLIFFAVFAFLVGLGGRETHHPIIKRRLAKKNGHPLPPPPPLMKRMAMFLTISLIRPIIMLFTEPIVGLLCLYTACEFATLFTFFAAIPYVFTMVYDFSIEQTGLVFISIILGCLLGAATIIVCSIIFYLPQTKKYPPHQTPPEYRLYPAMIGSIGLPISLFWFAWTSRSDVSWASPVVAIMPFAWGNICLFVAVIQYLVDTYSGLTVASVAGANSLARYTFAGAFPLFTIQMYRNLGIAWASSLLGFIALALCPLPWVFFKWGPTIRAKSRFETRASQ